MHFELGTILVPLTEEGVLILASGMTFYNMKSFFNPSNEFTNANLKFHEYLKDALTNEKYTNKERESRLVKWNSALDKSWQICHPREEHLIPLHVAAGAAKGNIATIYEFQTLGYSIFNAIFYSK